MKRIRDRDFPAPKSGHYEPSSDRGGQRAAAIYTLVQTAKLNDADPQTWLADALTRLQDHPAKRINKSCPGTGSPNASKKPLRSDAKQNQSRTVNNHLRGPHRTRTLLTPSKHCTLSAYSVVLPTRNENQQAPRRLALIGNAAEY